MDPICVPDHDVCIVRGTTYEIAVALENDPYGISTDPANWQGTLGFRNVQRDDVPMLLTLTSPLVLIDNPKYPLLTWQMSFTATPTQTQTLPFRDIVVFCELSHTTANWKKRLWQGLCHIGD